MTNNATITPCDGRDSACLPDVDGALDYNGVKIEIHGLIIDADVTLCPDPCAPARHPRLMPYGADIDHWISGAAVRAILDLDLTDDSRIDLLRAIVRACVDGEIVTVEDLEVESEAS